MNRDEALKKIAKIIEQLGKGENTALLAKDIQKHFDKLRKKPTQDLEKTKKKETIFSRFFKSKRMDNK